MNNLILTESLSLAEAYLAERTRNNPLRVLNSVTRLNEGL